MTTLSRFEIHQPQSVAEASQMLGHYGDDGAIYAGGTELLLAMRHRALSYSHLIDLKVIPALNALEPRDGVIEIGAACTHRAIERSALVREKQPVFSLPELMRIISRRAKFSRGSSSRARNRITALLT